MKEGRRFKERLIDYIFYKTQGRTSYLDLFLVLMLTRKIFRKTYKFIQESQWWSQEQLEAYQLEQLNKLLDHSYINVPYYRKLFDKHGLKPEDIRSFEDLQKIPFLTKDIVKNNIDDLKARNYHKHKFERVTTGGTTGIPLKLYVEKGVSIAESLAYSKAALELVECSFMDKVISLREDVILSKDDTKFWKYILFGRHLLLSSFHMSEDNLPRYVEKIRRFKPKFIVTFPSSITTIAKYMKKNNIEPFSTLKAIICGGESVYDWQRHLLEEVFQCRIFEMYGHMEGAVLACSCEKNNYYHVFPQYGIVELIDKYEKPVTKEGEKGEIVATGFHNFIFPFIRYKTGDIGVYTKEKCECGRNYPLLKKIEGKWKQEFIITGDNRMISTVIMHMHSTVFDNVKQFQFYQEKKGEVVFRIVKTDNYAEKDTKNIENEICKKLGKDIKLKIEFVDKIPRTERGKHKYLIQKIPIE